MIAMFAVFFSLLITGIVGTPPPTEHEHLMKALLGEKDFQFAIKHTNASYHHGKRTSFKSKYVGANGAIQNSRYAGSWLQVEATQSVSDTALYRATLIISRVTKAMPSTVFNNLAAHTKVGVFTLEETLTVFPEYAYLRDSPACRGQCSGSCANSCTGDGRKYSTLAGTGGQVAAILDDNVLCDSEDPYRHQSNILVHEFAHTVYRYGVSSYWKSQIQAAFNHARSAGLWTASEYAMSNVEEYWAESSQVWFNVEHLSYSTAGMNRCGGQYCSSENAARNNLYHRDIKLYTALVYVYTNNQPAIASGLSLCVTG